ncbi:MAG TPA: phenylacetate--CoA ligase [Chloroflexi bacterium]|jgi:phenylacetate-CoA ligase|nr:phenylacetate--CoA ligase [Chloroflexota bacterium]
MVWNRQMECAPRHELEAIQLERLQKQVARVYEAVPFYREAFRQAGITPQDVRSLDDMAHLPFTRKSDFRDQYPFGLLAVPTDDVVRVHGSSGTTGKPTVVAYTANDIAVWAEVMARTLGCGGVTRRDVVHNAYGYGLFTGGLGLHYGAERLGAMVVPMSGGNTSRQLMLMQDFGATALCCTPSYAIFLAEAAQEMGIDWKNMHLRVGFFGAEPWSDGMRQEIEARMGITALDIYGLSEIIGPGVSAECTHKCGLHIAEDHFLPEIIDPETGKPLPYGEVGELTFTTLTKEALPVIRYRTGDIARLDVEPCACGRTSVRMSKISGRTDDMIIVRGVNVFPSQIEEVLLRIRGVQPHYLIIVDREDGAMDTIEIWVEVSEGLFSDALGTLADLQRRAELEIQETLGISAQVRLVEPHRIERSTGKARRVLDRRDVYREQNSQ